eukprot:CAMPEP_0179122832 /NCGR_PEP_ID=MMETSP0796-20121207/57987_1 /TAXON_ID=73915 /ORGANISM="Pyrodinium bahamense, Strain pbaha01" /LENGTH=289 /DNA_ID=CAMNT_0020821463 /DNA_START=29 /DNA_END=898 /DNA_ORIENTATION=+
MAGLVVDEGDAEGEDGEEELEGLFVPTTPPAEESEVPEGEPGEEPRESEAQSQVQGTISNQIYAGLVHRVGPKTGNLLIKSGLVTERYGMEAMILNGSNRAGAQVCDKVTFKVIEREGQRPLATSVRIVGRVDRIIPDKGKGKDKGSVKGKVAMGQGKAAIGQGKATIGQGKSGGGSGGGAAVAFVGIVARQSTEAPFKLFIDCENITAAFGDDAWFLPSDKPPNVTVGSLVAFAASPEGRATWVCKLAPLGKGLWAAQTVAAERTAAAGIAGRTHGVQKTIVKKAGPK